ncbi:MAG: hypothetical protein ACTHJJ_05465, partial [Intrasporangium sp.]|uniref:hypothetical protein n=1 Tax=Intrasporangium sp. TaxID=1925024 RepID=UPI003F7CFA1B
LPVPRTRVRGWSVYPGKQWLDHRFRQAENPVSTPTIVVRTALQKRVGGYDPELPKAADMEMFMRMAAHADMGFVRGVDQAYYRLHADNMSKAVSALMDLRQRRSVFEVVLDRYVESLVDPGHLSERVHQQLAKEALWAAGRVSGRGRLRGSELGRRLMGAGPGEEEAEVAELLSFAADCWPEVKRLSLYRKLDGGGNIGPRELQFLVEQKGRWWLRRRLWKYRGY